jgi:3-deoxy-D-manno-octulosonic-acid transferase
MIRFFYNLLMPTVFMFFLPGLLIKYRNRGGWKSTYGERFGRFSPERRKELEAFRGAVWIHAVSVGETVVALNLVRALLKERPEIKVVISTTTTTGQELARRDCPPNTAVIFCPIDFWWMVKRTFRLIRPSMLVIFETEIWPNLICEAKRRKIPLVLANGRMSDHSVKGYRKIKFFIGGLLAKFDRMLVQSDGDAKRYLEISPRANIAVCGNMKFDQEVPADPGDANLDACFGTSPRTVILGASTHSGEEELLVRCFTELKAEFPELKLVLVPRHAERGADIAAMLQARNLKFARRSQKDAAASPVDVLLADTTGEMLKFMKASDVVVMGKSLAGHDEGHNLIEPALLGKPIVTGAVLRNFRFLLRVLKEADAVETVAGDAELAPTLRRLLADASARAALGARAKAAIGQHRGATERTVAEIGKLLK